MWMDHRDQSKRGDGEEDSALDQEMGGGEGGGKK